MDGARAGGDRIGYAAALERTPPGEAAEIAAYAESRGFSGTLATDHFQPWLVSQGQSPFVWSVLTAIAERTLGDFGPGMAVPGYRYHPAVVAQASATLAAMYGRRHWLGIGSGEALNEHVTGTYWPEAPERINRMFEAIDLIKRLFSASVSGKDVKYAGSYYRMESTRLWTMPDEPPPVLVATGGPVTAHKAGKRADGLVTIGSSYEQAAQIIERFTTGATEAGKDPDSMQKIIHMTVSWAPTRDEAVANAAAAWPMGGMRFPKGDLRSPHVISQITKLVRPDDMEGRLVMSEDPDEHRADIQRYLDLGFDRIYLHGVGTGQREWIDVFATHVLPALR